MGSAISNSNAKVGLSESFTTLKSMNYRKYSLKDSANKSFENDTLSRLNIIFLVMKHCLD